MRTVHEYSHLGGTEILQVRHPEVMADIRTAIATVTPAQSRESADEALLKQCLYTPENVNDQFVTTFRNLGFEQASDPFTVARKRTQVAFLKQRVYVELQLGTRTSMFYDLAKFQHFYHSGNADVAVEITPAYARSQRLSDEALDGQPLLHDIEQIKRHFPVAPISVLLIDV